MKQLKSFAKIGVVIGIVIFIIGFALIGFDPKRLREGGSYTKKNFVSATQINSIQVEHADVNVKIVASEKD